MAAITSANVTTELSWARGDRFGKQVASAKRLKIVLSSQGGTAGDIPKAALGFAEIYEAYSMGLDVGSSVVKWCPVGVAVDGSEIIPYNPNQATDANRYDRANVTGDLYVTVFGRLA